MKEKPLSILIVEDNQDHIDLIRRSFEESNSDAILIDCQTLAAANENIQTNTPCLVITDLNLPDGKGTDLIEFSTSNNAFPVILMTSFGNENVAANAIKSGALDYIVKSSEAFTNLPSKVNRVMREWRHVTEKIAAQKALSLQEREQREILDSIMDAVITINQKGTVLTFNKMATKLFGYTQKEIIGRSFQRLLPKKFADRYSKNLQGYLNTGADEWIDVVDEIVIINKDNSTFPVRLSLAELPMNSSGIKRFIASCQDLTELKHQEYQLRRAQKMEALGKLTGGIAHDYNNMLGVVLGYADLLKNKLKAQPKLAEYAYQIHHAAERGAKLTNKLLSFTRKQSLQSLKIDINSLLDQQKDMLQKTLTLRIKLDFNFCENIWTVMLDDSEFEDAILNISINAMHAMSEQTRDAKLTISTSNVPLNKSDALSVGLSEGDYVCLSIRDTGSGMNATTKDKIFDPFFTTKGDQGSGLGLAQVFGFIQRSEGAIEVISKPDEGCEIILYFPRYFVTSPDLASKITDKHNPVKGNETVLVVDDEDLLTSLVTEILSNEGYRVLCANGAKKALSILESNQIDLLITDIIMPGMNGYRLSAIVKENYPSIKIQLTSGYSDHHDHSVVDEKLFQSLLYKPYNSNHLLKKIRWLLDN